jgi:hypothetical protein
VRRLGPAALWGARRGAKRPPSGGPGGFPGCRAASPLVWFVEVGGVASPPENVTPHPPPHPNPRPTHATAPETPQTAPPQPSPTRPASAPPPQTQPSDQRRPGRGRGRRVRRAGRDQPFRAGAPHQRALHARPGAPAEQVCRGGQEERLVGGRGEARVLGVGFTAQRARRRARAVAGPSFRAPSQPPALDASVKAGAPPVPPRLADPLPAAPKPHPRPPKPPPKGPRS